MVKTAYQLAEQIRFALAFWGDKDIIAHRKYLEVKAQKLKEMLK